MSDLFVTVAICTWNHCNSLRNTLTSLQDMEVPADIKWEVLIVNNNCTDDTDSVIASFSDTLPIRTVLETQQGLSFARNRAVAEARGNFILWTDDDVIVSPRWLAAYADAYRAWPDAAVFGGPIFPELEEKQQAWLLRAIKHENIAGAFAFREFGPEYIKLTLEGNKIPYGPNFAVRAKEQQKFLYDPGLGRVATSDVRGEEVDVIQRILKSGAEGRWVPDAPVQHVIPEHMQTVGSLRRYYVGQGRFQVRVQLGFKSKPLFGAPRWLWRAAITTHIKYTLNRLFAKPEIWSQDLRRAAIFRGQLLEYWRIRR